MSSINLPYLRASHRVAPHKLLSYSPIPSIVTHDECDWVALSHASTESYALIQSTDVEKIQRTIDSVSEFSSHVELWMTEDAHKSAVDNKLNMTKLRQVNTMHAMYYDLTSIKSLPFDFRVRNATSDDKLAISNIITESFNIPYEAYKDKLPIVWSLAAGSENPDINIYVTEISGEVCGTLTAVIHEKVVHVWAVGVLKSYRRMGIGAGLLAVALINAKTKGAEMGFLCATADGKHLYEATGWNVAEPWITFYND